MAKSHSSVRWRRRRSRRERRHRAISRREGWPWLVRFEGGQSERIQPANRQSDEREHWYDQGEVALTEDALTGWRRLLDTERRIGREPGSQCWQQVCTKVTGAPSAEQHHQRPQRRNDAHEDGVKCEGLGHRRAAALVICASVMAARGARRVVVRPCTAGPHAIEFPCVHGVRVRKAANHHPHTVRWARKDAPGRCAHVSSDAIVLAARYAGRHVCQPSLIG